MTINKKLAIAIAGSGLIGMGVIGTTALAATDNSSSYPSIVQKLADKFHLNPADVQSVFKENQQDRQTKHEAMLKSRLDQAVKDGKLTQDQEDKLITELKTLHDKYKSDNKADRRANGQKLHDELDQWAKDNGINLDQVLPKPANHHPDQG